MSYIISKYIDVLYDEGREGLDDNGDRDGRGDYLGDDLEMEITGNDGAPTYTYNSNMAREIVGEEEFQNYMREFGSDVGEIMSRGEETIDVYARYMVLDYYLYSKLKSYGEDLLEEHEEDEEE